MPGFIVTLLNFIYSYCCLNVPSCLAGKGVLPIVIGIVRQATTSQLGVHRVAHQTGWLFVSNYSYRLDTETKVLI